MPGTVSERLRVVNGNVPVAYNPATDIIFGIRNASADANEAESDEMLNGFATGPGVSTAHSIAAFKTTDGQTLEDSGVLFSAVALLAGAQTFTGAKMFSQTLTTTNPASQRQVYGQLNLTFAGIVTIGGGTGSVAGVRGEVSGAAGTTLKDGFYYGAQGKFILGGGTIDQTSAARFCGMLAQLDVSAGTMTNGQLSALWADMGASAAGAFAPETNIIRATNTTAQAVNALLYGYGKSTYALDLSDNGGGAVSSAAVSSATGAGFIKVNINGATRYINLYSGVPA